MKKSNWRCLAAAFALAPALDKQPVEQMLQILQQEIDDLRAQSKSAHGAAPLRTRRIQLTARRA